jgi:hypothetical protein
MKSLKQGKEPFYGKIYGDIPAGPIWDQKDAEKKCPIVCAAHLGKWNGQWKTVVEGEMSVCGCEYETKPQGTTEILIDIIGPIWNNDTNAKEKARLCALPTAASGPGNGIPRRNLGKTERLPVQIQSLKLV